MLSLIQLEYFKLRNTRYFWIILGLFGFFLLSLPIASKAFLEYMASLGEDMFKYMAPDEIPLFDFVDIWQNLTWTYKLGTIFVAFLSVISICNEFSYGTVKQNIMDGLSRKEWLISKLGFIVVLSVVVSLIVLIIGLIMGFLWSPVKGFPFIIKNIEFIPAYCLHLIGFQFFCAMIALLVRRSGYAITLILFYWAVIENVLYGLMRWNWNMEALADYLPLAAIGNVIRIPFGRYILQETQSHVALLDVLPLLGYTLLFAYVSYQLVRRDLS